MADRTRQGRADREGWRIGAQYGLGRYLDTWDAATATGWAGPGWTLAVIGILGTALGLHPAQTATQQEKTLALVGSPIVLAIGVLIVAIPRGVSWRWLHQYEAGLAEVAGSERRVSVMRWADLAALTVNVRHGYDDAYINQCVLTDHAGNRLRVSARVGRDVCELIVGRAEQVLAARLVGPLTSQLDAGLPITVGHLTMDRRGIRYQNDFQQSVNCDFSWQQVLGIETRFHGHWVTVKTHQGSKEIRLPGAANDFLAGYALQHAARLAAVPFTAA